MKTYKKLIFLGILSLVGLLAIPSLVTAREDSWGQHEGTRGYDEGELRPRDRRSFEEYLDTHWETAQLLYQQPELINDREFLRDHRALRDWLEEHTRATRVIQANPSQVLWEQRASHTRPDRTISSAKLGPRDRRSFEEYLDAHWKTAQLLYQQPDLINDLQFLRDHRALRDWLEEHTRAARIIQANPSEVLWERRGSHTRSDGTDSSSNGTVSSEDVQSLDSQLDTHW